MNQMKENIAFMKEVEPLNAGEKAAIEKAVAIINGKPTIPCTACKYCVEGCPKQIPIPDYFGVYNNQLRFRLTDAHKGQYRNFAKDHGKASDCIACRACEGHCPQHIEIVEKLKEVAKVFE
jgi:predicted aldo/keto reductase-like oxidoreductase